MKEKEIISILDEFIQKYPELLPQKDNIYDTFEIIKNAFSKGNRLYICGNGGSSADSLHIVGELMKSFMENRLVKESTKKALRKEYPEDAAFFAEHLHEALPAFALLNSTSLETAYSNDVCPEMVFAQQVYGYGKKGDVLLGISTSGNSKNVINAVKVANVIGMHTIALTGKDGGVLKNISETSIVAPRNVVYEIQEMHLPIYHVLCIMLEKYFFC